jgi:hypothetical protein
MIPKALDESRASGYVACGPSLHQYSSYSSVLGTWVAVSGTPVSLLVKMLVVPFASIVQHHLSR